MLIVVVGSIMAYFAIIDDGDDCPKGRMPWSCLSWVTVDRYEDQLREDLPIGSLRRQVEDYLNHEGIAFSSPASAPSSLFSQLTIDKSLPGLWQRTFHIVIVFGTDDRVTEIRFRKSMIAL